MSQEEGGLCRVVRRFAARAVAILIHSVVGGVEYVRANRQDISTGNRLWLEYDFVFGLRQPVDGRGQDRARSRGHILPV